MSLDLQAVIEGIPAVRAYGLHVVPEPDGVRLSGELQPDAAVYQDTSHAHGGAVATILDTAATFAILAVTATRWVTVDLRVDYLRPTRLGPVTCTARVASRGGHLCVVRAELGGHDGRPTALAAATMYRAGDGSVP